MDGQTSLNEHEAPGAFDALPRLPANYSALSPVSFLRRSAEV
jgi:hypothetical protein